MSKEKPSPNSPDHLNIMNNAETENQIITPNERWQKTLESIVGLTKTNEFGPQYNPSGEQEWDILCKYYNDLSLQHLARSVMGPRHYLSLSIGQSNLLEESCQLVEKAFDTFDFEPLLQSDKKIEKAMVQFSLAQNIKRFTTDKSLSKETKQFLKLVFSPNNYKGAIPNPIIQINGASDINRGLNSNSFSRIVGPILDNSDRAVFLGEASSMGQKEIITPKFSDIKLWSEDSFGAWKNSKNSQIFENELKQLDEITSQYGEELYIWPGNGIALAYPQPKLLLSVIDHSAAIHGEWYPSPTPDEEAIYVLKRLISQKNWPQAKQGLLETYPGLLNVAKLIETPDYDKWDLASLVIQYNDNQDRHGKLQNEAISSKEKFLRKYPQLRDFLESIDKTREEVPKIYGSEKFIKSKDSSQTLERWTIYNNINKVESFVFEELGEFSQHPSDAVLQVIDWLDLQISKKDLVFLECSNQEFEIKLSERLLDEEKKFKEILLQKYPQLINIFESIAEVEREIPEKYKNTIANPTCPKVCHKTELDQINNNLKLEIESFILFNLGGSSPYYPKNVFQTVDWLNDQILNKNWDFFNCNYVDFNKKIQVKLLENNND